MRSGTHCLTPKQGLVLLCDRKGVAGSASQLIPTYWTALTLVSVPVTKMGIYYASMKDREGEGTLSEPLVWIRPCVVYSDLLQSSISGHSNR